MFPSGESAECEVRKLNKIVFSIPVALATFCFGLAAIILFSFYPRYSIDPESVPAPEISKTAGCAWGGKFPGRSREIGDLKVLKDEYFPTDLMSRGQYSSNFWYSRQLETLDESPLTVISNSDKEIYRFVWLRTFHDPVSVRVVMSDGNATVFVKRTNGAGGYDPGELIADRNFELREYEWCTFVGLLDKADFWRMQTEIDDLGQDGSQWILEGVKEGRYHVVDRWSPDSGEFREACIYLLMESGLIPESKEELY